MTRTTEQANRCICPILYKENIEAINMTSSSLAQFEIQRAVKCQAPDCMAWEDTKRFLCDSCGKAYSEDSAGRQCGMQSLSHPLARLSHMSASPKREEVCNGKIIVRKTGYCKLLKEK